MSSTCAIFLFPVFTKCALCASSFASIDWTPPTLHTASLYALLTCAKWRVSFRLSFGSISPMNTSGSCTATASRISREPRRRYVTVSDSYTILALFCASMAARSEWLRGVPSVVAFKSLLDLPREKKWTD